MKKLCALFLCAAMLLSCVCVVQAATAVNVQETFDDLTVGATEWSRTVFGNYEANSNGAAISISDDGYIGNCLTITENDTTGFKIYSKLKETTLAASNVYTFKLKILEDVNATAKFHIFAGSSDGLLYIQNGEIWCNSGTRFNYDLDTWYDVRIELTSSQAKVSVKGEKGESVSGYRNGSYNYWMLWETNTSVANASIAIDEVRLIQGDGTDALNITASSYGSSPSTKTVVANETFDSWTSGKLEAYMGSSGNWASKYIYDGERSTISRAEDCNGGICPVITGLSSYKPNGKSKSTAFETGTAYTSFKFKVIDDLRASNNGTGKSIAQLGAADGDGYEYIWVYNGTMRLRPPFTDGKAFTYTPDMWYTIVTTFEKADATTNSLTIKVYDDQGNVVLEDKGNSTAISSASVWFEGYGVANTSFSIDDVKVILEESSVSNVINGSTLTEILGGTSKENLYTTTPVIKASFDGIVADGSTAKFTATGKNDVAATIRYTGSSLVEIVPSVPLDYGTAYTLDLSGIKGLGGQGLATGSTAALSLNTPAYSVGTMTVGTPAYSGTNMDVAVTFTNAASKELNTYVIAALYNSENNKLEYAQVKPLTGESLGEKALTFTGVPENASTMTLKIFAWDNFASLKPLFN